MLPRPLYLTVTSCISEGSPEKQNPVGCIHRHFKQLAHAVVGAAKCEVYSAGQQARNTGRVNVAILSLKSAGQADRISVLQC